MSASSVATGFPLPRRGRHTGAVADSQGAPDSRPSDRAGPRRVGLICVHTSPLEQPGTGDSGGMNVYVAALARELVDRGVGVDVFTRAAGGDLPPTITTADGVRVHHLSAGPPGVAKQDLATHLCAFYLSLATHPVVQRLDLLHGHYWMSGWVGRKLRTRLGLPLVQSFHTLARAKNARLARGDQPEPMLRLAAEERVVDAADAIIVPTRTEENLLRSGYGARPEQLHVVEPGVDLDVFTTAGDRHRDRQVLGGGRIILFVGRLQPLKGPDVAVRALAELDRFLPDDGVPTRLVIVGGASGNGHGTVDPKRLRLLAAEVGVEGRVAFLGPRPQHELAALYRAADAVIVPSHSESFGLVALEAQACGTPVVAADVGGLRHALAAGEGGTLVEGHRPRDYAEALLPYLTDAHVRAAASRAADRHAGRFSWSRTVDGTMRVYESVMARTCAADTRQERGA